MGGHDLTHAACTSRDIGLNFQADAPNSCNLARDASRLFSPHALLAPTRSNFLSRVYGEYGVYLEALGEKRGNTILRLSSERARERRNPSRGQRRKSRARGVERDLDFNAILPSTRLARVGIKPALYRRRFLGVLKISAVTEARAIPSEGKKKKKKRKARKNRRFVRRVSIVWH